VGAVGKGGVAVREHFLLPALGAMVVVVGCGGSWQRWGCC